MSNSECAVVLTAGYGSRLFPVTAVVPKSLMPVGRFPVVHHLLADLVAAGVDDIAIVVGAGDDGLRRYVEGDSRMAHEFARRGWTGKYEAVTRARDMLAGAQFTFVEQDLARGEYGTAVPARLARDFISGRDCFYLSGDDLLMDPVAERNIVDLASLRESAEGAVAAIQVSEVDRADTHRYGIVSTRVDERERLVVESLVEKSESTQGTLANISRYLLTDVLLDAIGDLRPDEATGEYMVTTAVHAAAQEGAVGVSVAAGTYFDCGSESGWLAANGAYSARIAEGP